jgi:glycosyltransferase involved in cell wall biosynthesis
MPTVSVVIPTFNRIGFLRQAIESVLGQTFRDFELIVVDDGSNDSTPETIENEYPEVRLVRQSRRGVSAARNRGVREAGGTWIAFLDSDDSWLPRKLERQLDRLNREKGYRICYTDEIWIRNGVRVNPGKRHRKFSGDLFWPSLPLCIVSPSSVMVEKTLFEEMGGFDESLPVCEDYDLWLRIAVREPFLFLAERLIVKRNGHPGQLSQTTWGMDRFRIRALEKLLETSGFPEERGKAAFEEMARKAKVYAGGCAKRGKTKEAEETMSRLNRFRGKIFIPEYRPGQPERTNGRESGS